METEAVVRPGDKCHGSWQKKIALRALITHVAGGGFASTSWERYTAIIIDVNLAQLAQGASGS